MLEEISIHVYKMESLQNLTKKEFMILAKYFYENMSRKQLEAYLQHHQHLKPTTKPTLIFTNCKPMPTPRRTPRPKKLKLMPTLRPKKPLSIPKDYKPRKIVGTYDNKYIEYKSEGHEQLSIEEQLENITIHLSDMIR